MDRCRKGEEAKLANGIPVRAASDGSAHIAMNSNFAKVPAIA